MKKRALVATFVFFMFRGFCGQNQKQQEEAEKYYFTIKLENGDEYSDEGKVWDTADGCLKLQIGDGTYTTSPKNVTFE